MSDQVESVGVVGMGTMGAGIAQLCVEAGFETIGYDLSARATDSAAERIAHYIRRKVDKGTLAREAAEEAIGRLRLTSILSDLGGCDLVIEAAFEDLAVKQAIFRELDAVAPSHAALATNTSALSVTAIATATSSPERVVGMHFFNPAPLMPLVEVVRAERTGEDAFATVFAFAKALGKTPIACADTPGFIVNRTLIPLLNDCVRILDEASVSPEALDEALELGAGWPLGPARLLDTIGLDVHLHASEALYASLHEPRMAPPARLVRLVAAGKLGRKSGEGFYRYP